LAAERDMGKTLAAWRAHAERGKFLLYSMLLAGLGIAAVVVLGLSEDSIRRVGLFYEALGVVSVLVQVFATEEKHGRDSPWARIKAYARDTAHMFCVSPPAARTLEARSGEYIAFGQEAAFSLGTLQPADLEARMLRLEMRVSQLHEDVSSTSKRIDVEAQTRTEAVNALDDKVEEVERRMSEAIKEVEIGALDINTFGLVWLFVGLMLTTATKEVHGLLYLLST
jgi:hypothetical protein